MIPSDAALCDLAARAYTTAPTWQAQDVRAVRTTFDGGSVIAFRGTDPADLVDWCRDLDIWPAWRRGIGFCHRGFVTGAEMLLPRILAAAWGRRVVLTGHSLGGALAIATAGLMARAGRPPVRVVTFGAPRVGLWRLRRALRHVAVRQYHVAGDTVPDVPWPYRQMSRPMLLPPHLDDPLAAHAVGLYRARMGAYR